MADGGKETVSDDELNDCPPFAPAEELKAERDMCGVYISGDPLAACKKAIAELSVVRVDKEEALTFPFTLDKIEKKKEPPEEGEAGELPDGETPAAEKPADGRMTPRGPTRVGPRRMTTVRSSRFSYSLTRRTGRSRASHVRSSRRRARSRGATSRRLTRRSTRRKRSSRRTSTRFSSRNWTCGRSAFSRHAWSRRRSRDLTVRSARSGRFSRWMTARDGGRPGLRQGLGEVLCGRVARRPAGDGLRRGFASRHL